MHATDRLMTFGNRSHRRSERDCLGALPVRKGGDTPLAGRFFIRARLQKVPTSGSATLRAYGGSLSDQMERLPFRTEAMVASGRTSVTGSSSNRSAPNRSYL